MPRDSNGNFSLAGTLVANTTARASDVNDIFDDLGDEVQDSLSRSGKGGMTGQLKAASGSVSEPGMSFSSDLDCGIYRIGTNNIGAAVNGAKVLDIATTGLSVTGTLGSSGALTVTSGGLTVTAGGLTVTAGSVSLPSASLALSALANGTASRLLGYSGAGAATEVTPSTGLALSSNTLTVDVASQAEVTAAGSNAKPVTPGRMIYSPYVAKAWVKFSAAGTIADSVGVSSVVRNSTGNWSVNWSAAFATSDYVVVVGIVGTLSVRVLSNAVTSQLTSGVVFQTFQSSDGAASESGIGSICIAAFGDL